MSDKYKILLFGGLVILFLSYSSFLYTNQPVTSSSFNTSIEKGSKVWQEYNCNSCHQIYGLGGYLGPDLTNEYSLRGVDFINAFLLNGTNIMPKFNLTLQQRNDLNAFLQHVDQSGIADPKSYTIYANGTIEQ